MHMYNVCITTVVNPLIFSAPSYRDYQLQISSSIFYNDSTV